MPRPSNEASTSRARKVVTIKAATAPAGVLIQAATARNIRPLRPHVGEREGTHRASEGEGEVGSSAVRSWQLRPPHPGPLHPEGRRGGVHDRPASASAEPKRYL